MDILNWRLGQPNYVINSVFIEMPIGKLESIRNSSNSISHNYYIGNADGMQMQ